MIFVDTNYFLRFLLKDNKDQFAEVESLFTSGSEGKIKLLTSTIVIFEIYWVLSSFYGKEKYEIAIVLKKILSLYFIELSEREMLMSAVTLFEKSNFDLEDSFNLAYAKGKRAKSFKTFDKRLAKEFKKNEEI